MAVKKEKFDILIVDDEPSVLLTYKLILESRGYAVQTAPTAAAGIRLVGEHPFNLLLCDYSLEQEHTGFEVIAAARARDATVSAVLLTGYASKETVDIAHESNIGVLFKPIDIEEFFRTIETLKRGQNAEISDTEEEEDARQDHSREKEQRAERSRPASPANSKKRGRAAAAPKYDEADRG